MDLGVWFALGDACVLSATLRGRGLSWMDSWLLFVVCPSSECLLFLTPLVALLQEYDDAVDRSLVSPQNLKLSVGSASDGGGWEGLSSAEKGRRFSSFIELGTG